MIQFTIEQFNIGFADNSTFNTQHCRRLQFTIDQLSIARVAANNSTLNIQNSTLKFALSSEEFSCQRVQSQTCLSYAECSRKSHVCKMYEIVNKQVKFLTSQYIGTCKSAYTKGYALN